MSKHFDVAPLTWQADRADALDVLGIHPESLNEELLATWQERRSNRGFRYRHLLRYNARKRELAEPAIERWLAERPFDFEPVALVREALDGIPERIADAEVEWYREEHKKRAENPKHRVRKFEPSFAYFPALFDGLRVAKARARGEVLATIKSLSDPLTAFASNQLPVEALGFTPISATRMKDRRAATLAASRAAKTARATLVNHAEAQRLESAARSLPRRSIAGGSRET